ncbi:helix-turn-helix transcriptional regulator [Bradyrhizobium sp. HKCCYLS20291]|uniref:AraC family transcriptional regulator n=1 Tax=Bradyrhizobium sp. HKCCYLS20291 TaxID=3420766 RepID=UPI003EB93BDC
MPGELPDDEYRLLWRRSIAPYFDAEPVERPLPGRKLPDIQQYHLGLAVLADSNFPAQRFKRDRRWMARYEDCDHVLFQLMLQGHNRVVNGNAEFTEQPGNVYAVNLAHQLDAQSVDGRAITLVLPRALLREHLPYLSDASGAFLPDGSTAARIFVDYLVSLYRNLAAAKAAEADSLIRTTMGLMDSLAMSGDIVSSAAKDASFAAICRYIEEHLGDFNLGTEQVCKRFRCSRSTVYRLFKPQGGLWHHIQRRRLIRCMLTITHPKMRHRRIFDIAVEFGFESASQFSRLFHEHFGMTPSQAREAGFAAKAGLGAPLPPVGSNALSTAELMARWATSLTRQLHHGA